MQVAKQTPGVRECKEAQMLAVGILPVCLIAAVQVWRYVWDTKVPLPRLYQKPPYGSVTYELKTQVATHSLQLHT